MLNLVQGYERGLLSWMEVFNKLMHLAADTPPAEIATGLPAGWLVELRRDCEQYRPCPPAGGMLVFRSACDGPEEAKRAEQEFSNRWRAGYLAWQAFFGIAS